LAAFGLPSGVYPVGRLDADSEGLLLLTDEAGLNSQLLDPSHAHVREYWAQIERIPKPEAIARLQKGLNLGAFKTRSCVARLIDPAPGVEPRDPPIRVRKTVPDAWLSLELVEGKNRQVRRMTAAIGHPTLRLIRVRIGKFKLGALPAGTWRELTADERAAVFQ
jgi:23S rRNA pseudouridine2457 synthase